MKILYAKFMSKNGFKNRFLIPVFKIKDIKIIINTIILIKIEIFQIKKN